MKEKDNKDEEFDDFFKRKLISNGFDESAIKRATGKDEVNLQEFQLSAPERKLVIAKCAKYPDFKDMKIALEETRKKYEQAGALDKVKDIGRLVGHKQKQEGVKCVEHHVSRRFDRLETGCADCLKERQERVDSLLSILMLGKQDGDLTKNELKR